MEVPRQLLSRISIEGADRIAKSTAFRGCWLGTQPRKPQWNDDQFTIASSARRKARDLLAASR